MASEAATLFVYGTLRRASGHAMGQWLAERAQWLGPARIAGALLRLSYYPGLVVGEGWVRGDLYRIPEALWPELDAFEDLRGQPDDEYRREPAWVQTAEGEVLAWVYWYQGETTGLSLVPGGDWLAS